MILYVGFPKGINVSPIGIYDFALSRVDYWHLLAKNVIINNNISSC